MYVFTPDSVRVVMLQAKKKSTRYILAALTLLVVIFSITSEPGNISAFSSGSGTVADPYVISDCNELQSIDDERDYMVGNYILANDIDCSGIPLFEPIGYREDFTSNYMPFMGRFDGQGYTISNVTIGSSTVRSAGIFEETSGASIRNVNLDNFTVDALETAGTIVGEANSTSLVGVSVTNATVTLHGTGLLYGGGMVGRFLDSNGYALRVSSSTVVAIGSSTNSSQGMVGGVAGNILRSMLDRVYSDATVTADFYNVGGLAGGMQVGSVIKNSYSDAVVSGYDAVGGIAGSFAGSGGNNYYIENVYSNASTSASASLARVGGILGGKNGTLSAQMFIKNSFAVGPVSSTTNSGGISGVPVSPASNLSNNVWYPTGTGQTRCTGPFLTVSAAQCTSNDTSLSYYYSSTNAPLSSWDFTNIWNEYGGALPDLQVFPYTEPVAPTAITTCADLASNIRANPTGWFALSNDIDCASDPSLLPLTGEGATSSAFMGIFDGQDFTISGIAMSKNATSQYLPGLGLFQYVYGATLQDVTLTGGGVTALSRYIDGTGALASRAYGVVVSGVTSTVPIHAGDYSAGGLFGYASGQFDNLVVTADIDYTYPENRVPYNYGGIVGTLDWGRITNSSYSGDIFGYWYTGGIVADAGLLYADNVTTSGTITGNVRVGGIWGTGGNYKNMHSEISNATSSMSFGPDSATDSYTEGYGGIVGYVSDVNLTNVYYSGTINTGYPDGTYYIGGIAGTLRAAGTGTSTIINARTDAYILADGDNSNPYIQTIGGFIGEGRDRIAIVDSIASTTMRFGADNPTFYMNGSYAIGGLIGEMYDSFEISNSEARGSIHLYEDYTGSSGGYGYAIGGLIGASCCGEINTATSSMDIILKSYEPGGIGGLAGEAGDVVMNDAHFTGDLLVQAPGNTYDVGGFVGYSYNNTISSSSVSGDVSVVDAYGPYEIGGFLGYSNNDTLNQVYTDHAFTVDMGNDGTSGGYSIGGFVGALRGSNTYTNTFASSTITVTSTVTGSTAGNNIGGYAGVAQFGSDSITNSYSAGSLTLVTDSSAPYTNVGGFIGSSADNTNTFSNNFAASVMPAVASSSQLGGFIGAYSGGETFANNAYDSSRTGQSLCTGVDAIDPAWCAIQNVGSSEPAYFFDSTNEPLATWNFTSIWLENVGTYPTFGVSGGGGPTPPTVTSVTPATSILASSVTLPGNISALGSSAVTTRGFVYGTTIFFGASTTESSGGFSTGAYSANVTGLVCNTTYYYAAYATNGDGTDYGATESFTTAACAATPPTVTTSSSVSGVTKTAGTVGGNIAALGSGTVTSRGVVYGLTPTLGATSSESSGGFSTGAFTANLSGLTCGTTYYAAAYASGTGGTAYGAQQTFTTSNCSNGSSQTKVNRTDDSVDDVLNSSDSITICHKSGKTKYVSLENVQLFIELATSGLTATLRGHDGHIEDIVPAFKYNFGDGVKTYTGNNWTAENQALHANDCKLFLAEEETPVPVVTPPPVITTPPVTVDPQPEPTPEPEEIAECESESEYTRSIIDFEGNALVVTVPAKAVYSPEVEADGVKNYGVAVSVKKQDKKSADSLAQKFLGLIEKFKKNTDKDEAPKGLLKKTNEAPSSVFIAAPETAETQTSTTESLVVARPAIVRVTEQSPCVVDEEDIVLPEEDEVQVTPTPDSSEDSLTTPDTEASFDDDSGQPTASDNNSSIDSDESTPNNNTDSVQDDATTDSSDGSDQNEDVVVIVSDDLTEEDLSEWAEAEEEMELLVEPFEVELEDPYGNILDELEEPIEIEIENDKLAGLTEDDILIVQPSVDGTSWHEVEFSIDDDKLTVVVRNPGKVFVWIKPKTAIAAEEVIGEDFDLSEIIPLKVQVPLFLAQLFTVLGLLTGLYTTASSATQVPVSITTSRHLFGRSYQSFLALFAGKKKKKPWGTVYDSETKAPLDPAYVQLLRKDGSVAAEAVTDLDGRYGFVVPEDAYTMRVQKTNYAFPSKKNSAGLGLYEPKYFGAEFTQDGSIAYDIPLDPVTFDWNQYEKLRTNQTAFYNKFDPFFARLLDIVFGIGFVFMVWQLLAAFSILTLILTSIYTAMLVRRLLAGKPPLFGFVTRNGKPLPHAVIKVKQNNVVVRQKVADEYGRYSILVPPGSYVIEVGMQSHNERYIGLSEHVVKAKKGIVNENVRI